MKETEMQTPYRTFRLLCRVGNGARHFDVIAISVEAAYADICAAYGELELIQAGAV